MSATAPWRTRLAAVLGPLVVLSVGTSILSQGSAPPPAAEPVLQTVAAGPSSQSDTVLLGNSLVIGALDSERMRVTSLAAPGSGVAHWVATVARAESLSPRRYILYANPQSLDDVALTAGEDEQLLNALLPSPDPVLVDRAVGGGGVLWRTALRNRSAVRRGLLEAIGHGPVQLALGHLARGPIVDPAVHAVFTKQPVDKVEVLPTGMRNAFATKDWPDSASLDAGLVSLLIERVNEQGASLLVVLPIAREPVPCTPDSPLHSAREWLAQQPMDLLDLSDQTLHPDQFEREYHVTPSGRREVTKVVSRELRRFPIETQDSPMRVLCGER